MKEDMNQKELLEKIAIEVEKHNKEKAHGKYRVFIYQKGFKIFHKGFETESEAAIEILALEALSALAYRKIKTTIEDENGIKTF